MLSTAHDDRMTEIKLSKENKQKMKPVAVADYSKYKICTDKSD
jgi:hypothetical protein